MRFKEFIELQEAGTSTADIAGFKRIAIPYVTREWPDEPEDLYPELVKKKSDKFYRVPQIREDEMGWPMWMSLVGGIMGSMGFQLIVDMARGGKISFGSLNLMPFLADKFHKATTPEETARQLASQLANAPQSRNARRNVVAKQKQRGRGNKKPQLHEGRGVDWSFWLSSALSIIGSLTGHPAIAVTGASTALVSALMKMWEAGYDAETAAKWQAERLNNYQQTSGKPNQFLQRNTIDLQNPKAHRDFQR